MDFPTALSREIPRQALERNEFWNDLFDATEELNPRDRELFHLRWVEKRAVHEIAASMNLSDKTASKAIRRMEERLREVCVKIGLPETYPEIVGRIPPPPRTMQTISSAIVQG